MERDDRSDLLEALVERLQAEGVPAGTWLIDISAVRTNLRRAANRAEDLRDEVDAVLTDLACAEHEADLLLERLQTALIRGHERAPG